MPDPVIISYVLKRICEPRCLDILGFGLHSQSKLQESFINSLLYEQDLRSHSVNLFLPLEPAGAHILALPPAQYVIGWATKLLGPASAFEKEC